MNPGRLRGVSQEFGKRKRPCPKRLHYDHVLNSSLRILKICDFLESMKTDGAATFGSHDKLLASKIEHRQKRLRLEDLHCEKHSSINESNALGMLDD